MSFRGSLGAHELHSLNQTLLLKLGLDLCVPMESRSIAGKTVGSIGGGVLMTCLTDKITRDGVEPLAQGIVAWHKELAPAGDTTCIFRDSAFADHACVPEQRPGSGFLPGG